MCGMWLCFSWWTLSLSLWIVHLFYHCPIMHHVISLRGSFVKTVYLIYLYDGWILVISMLWKLSWVDCWQIVMCVFTSPWLKMAWLLYMMLIIYHLYITLMNNGSLWRLWWWYYSQLTMFSMTKVWISVCILFY